MRLSITKGLVRGLIEQGLNSTGVVHLDLHEPSFARRGLVDQAGVIRKILVDLGHLTRNWVVHVRRRFDGLNGSKLLLTTKAIAHLGQIYVHDVAEAVLGKVGDADRANVAVQLRCREEK